MIGADKRSISNAEFNAWVRDVINPQAKTNRNISLDDYTKDGMNEYLYPGMHQPFIVNGDSYTWSYGSNHTKGRHLCNHYELWFHGPAFRGKNQGKIATGNLTLGKFRKGLKIIYKYYYHRNASDE